jgi:hypothetical protein
MKTYFVDVYFPVYDWEYNVIGKWKKETVKAHKTKNKGNFCCNVGYLCNPYIFDKSTGLCVNRKMRKCQAERLRTHCGQIPKVILPYMKMDSIRESEENSL